MSLRGDRIREVIRRSGGSELNAIDGPIGSKLSWHVVKGQTIMVMEYPNGGAIDLYVKSKAVTIEQLELVVLGIDWTTRRRILPEVDPASVGNRRTTP